MSISAIINIVQREISRALAGRRYERHALVTAWDKATYCAKVKFLPEGIQSGWMETEAIHAGNGFVIMAGLTPGSGNPDDSTDPNSSQYCGDQVIIRLQEGDIESGKIVSRVHSDKDKKPEIDTGEIMVLHITGNKIWMAKDGSIQHYHKSGGFLEWDKNGNFNVTTKNRPWSMNDGNGGAISSDGNGNLVVTGKGLIINAPTGINSNPTPNPDPPKPADTPSSSSPPETGGGSSALTS